MSEQSVAIEEFIDQNRSYEAISAFVNRLDDLDDASVQTLKKKILAGFWTSQYGLAWSKAQEINFWEMVYAKCQPQTAIAALTLAESYRGNGLKSLKEVIHLYFEAIDLNLEHYFSLTQDGGTELEDMLREPLFLQKCLLIEIDIWEKLHHYSLAEIEEESPYLLKKCKGKPSLEALIKSKINALKQRKALPHQN